MLHKLTNRAVEKLLVTNNSQVMAKVFKKVISDRKKPFFVQIEPTTTCNLGCVWCVHSKVSTDNFKKMTFERFKHIIDQYPFISVLKFSGIGEFFTNSDFTKMIEYLKTKKVMYSCFTSNFTVMSEKNIETLANSNINTVFVSIDGSTKETFANIRKGANLDLIIDNMKKFQAAKRKKTKIIVRAVMSNQNKHELIGIVDLCQDLGIKQLHFQRLYGNEELQLTTQEYEDYKIILTKYATKLRLKFSSFGKKPVYKCLRALGVTMITVEGNVLPCSIITQRDDYFEFQKKNNLGNIYENSIEEIWNSEKYKNFRQEVVDGKLPAICNGCPYYE